MGKTLYSGQERVLMYKTIIISTSLNKNKIHYYEQIDYYLKSKGYCILLITNDDDLHESTTCESITVPTTIQQYYLRYGNHSLEHVTPEIIRAAMVDAEYPELDLQSTCISLCLFITFMKWLFKEKKIVLCIMFHEFNSRHHAMTDLCRKFKKPYLYTEFGALPGTMSFDVGGQMAESWVARFSEIFLKLPLDKNDLSIAKKYLDYIRETKKTREKQIPDESLKLVFERAKKLNRKIVFYAGSSDYASGMLPSSLPRSKVHSPIYKDTIDALKHLSELAEKNDWQIVFKPHPSMERYHKNPNILFPDRVDVVMGASIFECMDNSDIVVTILSQVSYYALIYHHPCVLLGINQLSDKGCVYQVKSHGEVELILLQAIQKGLCLEHKKKWLQHVAQLLKYYLFAVEEDVAHIIGRSAEETAHYLIKQSKQLTFINGVVAPEGYGALEFQNEPSLPTVEIFLKFRIKLRGFQLIKAVLPDVIFKKIIKYC